MTRAPSEPRAGPAWFKVAAILGRYDFSRSTLERRVRDGTFPRPAKLGGLRMWSAADLEAFDRRLLADRGHHP